jgi:hypothetical protein
MLSSEPDMFLSAGDSHLHVALHSEEVSLHQEWMCLVHHLKIKLLDNLSDKLVQLNLSYSVSMWRRDKFR